jgi:hypothetical protein
MAFAASENGLHPRGPVDARLLEPGGFKRDHAGSKQSPIGRAV